MTTNSLKALITETLIELGIISINEVPDKIKAYLPDDTVHTTEEVPIVIE